MMWNVCSEKDLYHARGLDLILEEIKGWDGVETVGVAQTKHDKNIPLTDLEVYLFYK